jgi:hypothetical protein
VAGFANGGFMSGRDVQYVQSGNSRITHAAAPQVNVQVVSNGIDLTGYLDVVVDGKLQNALRPLGPGEVRASLGVG